MMSAPERKVNRRVGMSAKSHDSYIDANNLIEQISMLQQKEEIQEVIRSSPLKGLKSSRATTRKLITTRTITQRTKDQSKKNEESDKSKTCLTLTNQNGKVSSKGHRRNNSEDDGHRVKFQQLNFPISKLELGTEEELQNIVEQLIPKAASFNRFGFKSYEKANHKRVFSDLLNLAPEKANGTIFVGELWNGSMTSKFMKNNKIKMNKLKFLEKMQDLKRDRVKKERQRELDSSSLIQSVKEFSAKSGEISLKSFRKISNRTSKKKLTFREQTSRLNTAMERLRTGIDEEVKQNKEENNWRTMKRLESQSSKMHKIWEGYYEKMLEMR